jgi:hypothetical protein
VDFPDFPYSTIVSRLLSDDRMTGDLDKLALGDLLSIEGLLQLLCSLIKRHDIVPGGFAGAFRVHRNREATCRTIVTGSEPWVTTQPAAQHHLGYSVARLWNNGVLSCDGF